ncbi:hypothetical protein NMY22_g18585 [Coprinellus aureogranulatus]|nr:hypothetical protein NMY22_g18585 [Coprinellus aureogranulatus]
MEDIAPPRLPQELIELILEFIALEPRRDSLKRLLACSLTNSALLPSCQRHIFHTVHLWPYIPGEDYDIPSHETQEWDRRTTLLVQAVNANPALGRYVQRLSHQVTSPPSDDYNGLEDMLRAMAMMSDIVDFEFGTRAVNALGAISAVDFRTAPGQWKAAVSTLLRLPDLKTLRLSCINSLPLECLSAGIQALHFNRSRLSSESDLERGIEDRSLTLNPGASQRLVIGSLDLSAIERLFLKLLFKSVDHYTPLVRQASRLRELEMLVPHSVTSHAETQDFQSSPFSQIHPASQNSLRHLTIHNMFYFGDACLQLWNPYTRIVEDALSQLPSLDHLHINIFLQGFLDLLPQSMNPARWTRLLELFTMPGACPNLRKVAVIVHIRASDEPLIGRDNEGSDTVNKTVQQCKEDAERLVEMVSVLASDSQWQLLAIRPEIKFSFTIETSVGSRLRPKTYEF